MKKLLRAAVVLALVAALGASAAQAGRSSQKGVVNITLATYVWQPTTVAAMNDIVASFNKTHSSIQVSIVPVDVNSVHDKLLTSFVGGTAADIVHDEAADIPSFTQSGYLANLNSLIPRQPQGLDPALALEHGQLRPQVRVTGVPVMSQTYNVFANMSLLKAAGIKAPTVRSPWTWDQFRAAVEEADVERQLRRLLGPQVADRDHPDARPELGRAVELPAERASGRSRSARPSRRS